MKLGGLIPALVTPFDGNGEVNFPELRKLVNVLLEEGADGFYVTGSTGECFLLTDEERIRIVAAVTEEVNGRVPVVAHVGKIGAAQAAKLAREAEKAGADAVSSVRQVLCGDCRRGQPADGCLQLSEVFRRDDYGR